MSNFNTSNSLNESYDSFSRMQQHYWTTKQAVFQKLGKKEDDCIIASDIGLDLKLELFQTIEESFLTLMRVLESYQDKLCALAQEENVLGRFLKENGKQDKTKAGKAMCSAGKALSYSAQQRLTLRVPLIRLYQEVETFQYRAIVDTLQTIEKMEKARTLYRGTLMWMKDVSQQLDPDTCRHLLKFKKVQSKVRKAKYIFDNLKLDTLQKIDLLSFSRCNLFSQALSLYQANVLNLSKRVAHISNSVAEVTKGYQHYEFSMLKDLTETSKKLAESFDDKLISEDDKDTMLFFESEYHDEIGDKVVEKCENPLAIEDNFSENALNIFYNGATESDEHNQSDEKNGEFTTYDEELLEIVDNENHKNLNSVEKIQKKFSSSEAFESNPSDIEEDSIISCKPSFLPSELLNANFDAKTIPRVMEGGNDAGYTEETETTETKKGKQDMSAWFNLFADLDPLANPDLIGMKKNSFDDRNC